MGGLPPSPQIGKTLKFIHLSWFYQCLLKEILFPDCWKVSLVIDLFKNVGERFVAKNYCCISTIIVDRGLLFATYQNCPCIGYPSLFSNFVQCRLFCLVSLADWCTPMSWYKEESDVPPVIQGSKVPLLTYHCHRVQKVWTPLFMDIRPFHIFSKHSTFDKTFPTISNKMKYQINTKINSYGKVIFFILEGFKTMLNAIL